MTADRLVVVGGGPVALQAARAYRGEAAGEVRCLVSADAHLPYKRPPLSKDFLRGESEEDSLPFEDGTSTAITALRSALETRAQTLDTGRRVVTVSRGDLQLRLGASLLPGPPRSRCRSRSGRPGYPVSALPAGRQGAARGGGRGPLGGGGRLRVHRL